MVGWQGLPPSYTNPLKFFNRIWDCEVPENIHTPPSKGFHIAPPHPSGNSS